MATSVKSRVWRVLRNVESFQILSTEEARQLLKERKIKLTGDETVLGIYWNQDKDLRDALLVTDRAIHLIEKKMGRRLAYSEIGHLSTPTEVPKAEVREVILETKGGETVKIPVKGGGSRTADAFEFLRFLMRVKADQE
jgi:hypothetical protein